MKSQKSVKYWTLITFLVFSCFFTFLCVFKFRGNVAWYSKYVFEVLPSVAGSLQISVDNYKYASTSASCLHDYVETRKWKLSVGSNCISSRPFGFLRSIAANKDSEFCRGFRKNAKTFNEVLSRFSVSRIAKMWDQSCRSPKILQNECLLAKIGGDIAENEPSKVGWFRWKWSKTRARFDIEPLH